MEKANILLVEDDFNLGLVIQDTLALEGYKVHLCRDGKEGLKYYNKNKYDLAVLDVMLPEKDGFSLAEDIRKIDREMPIIFLTAKSMTEDKIKGLEIGADDYITKPFENDEFLLRIKAVLKRTLKSEQITGDINIYEFADFIFDYNTFTLKHSQEDRKLTKKEADILRLLCNYKEQVIEREMILNMVWGDDSYFLGRSLDVFITKLRKYLKLNPKVQITNVHGVGFRLEVD